MDILENIHPKLLVALGGIFAILVIATIIVQILKHIRPNSDFSELVQRVTMWWVMTTVFTAAMVIGHIASLIFFALVSYLALKEYFSLIPTRRADRRILFWAYLAVPIQFIWIGLEWYGMFIIFIPVYMFLFMPLCMVLNGVTKGFLRAVGMINWGLMITVFCISHIAYLLVLPAEYNPNGGGGTLVLYLVFLTQFNDVAQYFWGKLLGRNKVLPSVSPGKTYEGLIGGIVTTTALATLLGGFLTPMSLYHSALAGLIISMAGFIGDVNISSLKRDLGIKDSSNMLPGHGGILDRVDSISFAAPLFFHYLYYLYYPLPV